MIWGSASVHTRYLERIERGEFHHRRRCGCGCKTRRTHRGMANGVCLITGCELLIRRWVRDARAARRVGP